MDYILEPKPEGCVFCHAIENDADHDAHLVLYMAEHTYVIMNRYPYTHAHLMVVPKRHVDRIEKLDAEEQRELSDLWFRSQSLVIEAFSPQGVNLGMNIGQAAGAGIESHLHAHIVPRWVGDTNFMPMLADSRIMPEHLTETFGKLKTLFRDRM